MGLTISDSDLLVIQLVNGQPVNHPLTYSNFRMLFPETSFPPTPVDDLIRPFGYALFRYTERPVPVRFEHTREGAIAWSDALSAFTNTWEQVPFTPEEIEKASEAQMQVLIQRRNMLLQACDWTQLPDVPLTPEQVEAWRVYRQALRDWPESVTDPFNPPPFPVSPS